jgi:hypothetical protein
MSDKTDSTKELASPLQSGVIKPWTMLREATINMIVDAGDAEFITKEQAIEEQGKVFSSCVRTTDGEGRHLYARAL